ncbi:MAG: tryptase [Solirubrobacteraceae bacterium]|jgi:hypothetical protein|nr:tryptase [Solirubrobacteraceae bacterium]
MKLCTKWQVVGALLLGALLAPALVPSGAAAIVGGTAPNRPWPAQALVSATIAAGTRSCGGTLVSGRWVLTAGHCVTEKATGAQLPDAAVTVRLGQTDLTLFAPDQVFRVDRIVREPLFLQLGPTTIYDGALLHLADPTPASPAFEPMRLIAASESALWSPGTVATVLGWGSSVFQGAATPQLQQAGVAINRDLDCAAAYPLGVSEAFDPSSMLCAGDGATDTCSGDSGGPLLVPRVDTFALAAVTSYGFQCGDPAKPGIYARIGAALMNAWVREHVPTAAIAISPSSPDPGADVALTATASGGDELARPAYSWDLDDDGQYDDDDGTSATLHNVTAGSTVVRVQETYPDGERALAREVVTTAGSPQPQPPPPPPPPPKPAPAQAPAPPADAPVPPGRGSSTSPEQALARLLAGPRSVTVRSLLDGRMSLGVRCSAVCTLSARLTLDGRTAKRLGLTRFIGSALIGTAPSRRLRKAGSVTLVIRLKPRAVRALRRASEGAMRVRVSARAGQRTQRLERTIKLHT